MDYFHDRELGGIAELKIPGKESLRLQEDVKAGIEGNECKNDSHRSKQDKSGDPG